MKRIPWLLYAYIGKELLVAVTLSLAALSLLVVIVFGFRAVSDGFDLKVVMPWILGCVGFSLYLTIPISLLFASTLVYGRLAADREYTALCASGVSPLQLYVPMAILSGAVTIAALASVGTVFAEAHYAQRNIARFLIKQLENMGAGQKRLFRFEGGQVYCEQVFNKHLRGVTVKKEVDIEKEQGQELDPNEEPRVTTVTIDARYAEVTLDPESNKILLTLTDFQVSVPDTDSGFLDEEANWHRFAKVMRAKGTMTVEFDIAPKGKGVADRTNSELAILSDEYAQNLADLRVEKTELEAKLAAINDAGTRTQHEARIVDVNNGINWYQGRLRRFDSEVWKRRAMALAMLTFPLVGFPVSLTLRYRHRLVSFFFGNLIVMIVFHPLLVAGEALAEEGVLPAIVSNSMSNVVLGIIAMVLFGRLVWR